MKSFAFIISILLILISCSEKEVFPPPSVIEPVLYSFRITRSLPHDEKAFTQGLVFYEAFFYEGTGLWGDSNIRKVAPSSGNVLLQRKMSSQYFGEGITLLNGKIFQLTWISKTGFVYDADTFDSLGTFSYSTEGWGLTHDDQDLIMSDGSSTLYFMDPISFELQREMEVTEAGTPVNWLNELEYINGAIYANIWQSDDIVIIEPEHGIVTGRIDLKGLLPDSLNGPMTDVLNGIAWDEAGGRLFVTGKRWPRVFEIELIEK